METYRNWLRNILVAIDQLGNALAGGNPDITISARIGFFVKYRKPEKYYPYWKALETIIDTTFYPLDGPNHCLKAYERDIDQGHVHGNDLMRALLGIIAITACLFISLFTWSLYLIGYRPNEHNHAV